LHGSGAPRQRPSATPFDPAFLNLAGGIAPQCLAEALRRNGHGRLCFYGPPATGKTEFAYVLADALDRELVVKTTSDLVSTFTSRSSPAASWHSNMPATRYRPCSIPSHAPIASPAQANHPRDGSWTLRAVLSDA